MTLPFHLCRQPRFPTVGAAAQCRSTELAQFVRWPSGPARILSGEFPLFWFQSHECPCADRHAHTCTQAQYVGTRDLNHTRGSGLVRPTESKERKVVGNFQRKAKECSRTLPNRSTRAPTSSAKTSQTSASRICTDHRLPYSMHVRPQHPSPHACHHTFLSLGPIFSASSETTRIHDHPIRLKGGLPHTCPRLNDTDVAALCYCKGTELRVLSSLPLYDETLFITGRLYKRPDTLHLSLG